MPIDNRSFMLRAIELARNGLGRVSPNPMVGCVIIRDGKIIGEGWHQELGGPHAEVNAINSVKNPEDLLNGELFVTLEPCTHFGKTPPCTDLILEKKIPSVFIAVEDPDPRMNGSGIKKLIKNGVKVTAGLLQEEAAAMNRRYLVFKKKRRPYLILKWAQTMDGFIARGNYESKWISNVQSRQLVHKWRSEEDAVLVGAKTVQTDNPRLNVRDWDGRNPVRLIIDPKLTVQAGQSVLDGSQRTIIFNSQSDQTDGVTQYIRISPDRIVAEMLEKLAEMEIQSVLVEGGAFTIHEFIRAGVWDEARVFISSQHFYEGIRAPVLLNHEFVDKIEIQNDRLLLYKNKDSL